MVASSLIENCLPFVHQCIQRALDFREIPICNPSIDLCGLKKNKEGATITPLFSLFFSPSDLCIKSSQILNVTFHFFRFQDLINQHKTADNTTCRSDLRCVDDPCVLDACRSQA